MSLNCKLGRVLPGAHASASGIYSAQFSASFPATLGPWGQPSLHGPPAWAPSSVPEPQRWRSPKRAGVPLRVPSRGLGSMLGAGALGGASRQDLVRWLVSISVAPIIFVKLDISPCCTLHPHHPQKWSWQLTECPLRFLVGGGNSRPLRLKS